MDEIIEFAKSRYIELPSDPKKDYNTIMPVVEYLENAIENEGIKGYDKRMCFFYISQPRIALTRDDHNLGYMNILGKGNNRLEKLYDVILKFINLRIL